MKVDYLIVGQGIAGSLLAYELINAGKTVLIINEEKGNTSSNKAAGIYNPITGRKMVKTWLADELFAMLEPYYEEIEGQLSTDFLYRKPIYRPFFDFEEQNDWSVKATEPAYTSYIKEIRTKTLGKKDIIDPVGGIMLNLSGYVNIPIMLTALRKYFQNKGCYQSEVFSFEKLETMASGVSYGETSADKVIFCDGPDVVKNPFWKHLPFRLVKGEIMEISSDLSEDMILNRSVFVLPKNGCFHVGSTYDHKHLNYEPTPEGIQNLQNRLHKVFDGDYTVIGKTAGIRPATFDRRPFIGLSGEKNTVGLFNGFGTKGVSLVPYFARHFVNYLLGKEKLMAEVNTDRVQ